MKGRQGDRDHDERGRQGDRSGGRWRPRPQWENDDREPSGYGREYDDFGSRASRGWPQVGGRRASDRFEPGEFGEFGEVGGYGEVDPGGYSGYGYRSDQRSAAGFEREDDPRRRFGVGAPRERFGAGAEGPYAGRGPKGYRRSDERVLEEVNQRLEDHPQIDASNIEVSCRNGEIVLQGSVEDRRSKRLAESCIEELPGVKDVRNELRVQSGYPDRGEDSSVSPSSGGRSGGEDRHD